MLRVITYAAIAVVSVALLIISARIRFEDDARKEDDHE